MTRAWWQVGMVAALAALAFAPGVVAEFFKDDPILLGERLAGVGPTDIPGLFAESYFGGSRGSPTIHGGQWGLYRPLGLAVLTLERAAFGMEPAGYHAVSLVLFALAALAVLRLLSALLPPHAAFLGALVFAAHPVHAEAVIPAYGQLDLLSVGLALFTLERWLAAARGGEQGGRGALLVACMALFAGLLVKESAVVVPGLAMLTRGLFVSQAERGLRRWIAPRDVWLAVPIALYLACRVLALGSLLPESEATLSEGYPLLLRAKVVLVGLAHSLRLLVLPWGQTVIYAHLREPVFGSVAAEVTWIALASLALFLLARITERRLALFAAGWFAIAFAPISNIIPLATIVAERALLLPSVSVAIGVAALALRAQSLRPTWLAPAGVGLLVAISVAAAWRVCVQWRTPVELWRSTARAHPRSPTAHLNVGMSLLSSALADREAGRPMAGLGEAERSFDTALDLNPNSRDAHYGRGVLAMLYGDCAGTIAHLEIARSARPNEPEIEKALRTCRQRLGR